MQSFLALSCQILDILYEELPFIECPLMSVQVLDTFARDMHYKYFALLIIPTTAYFVIANWVGWQYYRNS